MGWHESWFQAVGCSYVQSSCSARRYNSRVLFFFFFLFNSPLYCFCRKDVRSHSTLCLSPVTQSSVKERSNAFVALRVNERTEVVSCTIVHVLCTQEGPSVYPSAKNRLLGDQSRGLWLLSLRNRTPFPPPPMLFNCDIFLVFIWHRPLCLSVHLPFYWFFFLLYENWCQPSVFLKALLLLFFFLHSFPSSPSGLLRRILDSFHFLCGFASRCSVCPS